MYSRLSSDEQAVKAWFRHYSSGLASVGIRLGLTPPQQSELEHRLLAVCQDSDTATATKDASDPRPVSIGQWIRSKADGLMITYLCKAILGQARDLCGTA